jgi:uncharacterized membrane-anchored protein YhcB (DUF1043 family)
MTHSWGIIYLIVCGMVIGVVAVGINSNQAVFRAYQTIEKHLEGIDEKIDAIQEKLDEIEDNQDRKPYVNPIDL